MCLLLVMLCLMLYISHNFTRKNGTILALLFQFTSWMCQFLSSYDILVKMIESDIWCNFGKYGVRDLDTVVCNNGSKLIWTLTNYWAEEWLPFLQWKGLTYNVDDVIAKCCLDIISILLLMDRNVWYTEAKSHPFR